MKKFTVLLIVVLAVLICVPIFSLAQDSKVNVKVNDEVVNFDAEPVIKNGRTLVPLRAIFEKLGANVEWIGETKEIIATKGETKVKLKISDTNIFINNKSATIEVAPEIINSRTFVPIRFVSESFGATVEWDQESRTINIAYGKDVDATMLGNGEYEISISKIATDENDTYMQFSTKPAYYLVTEYVEKCEGGTEKWISEEYYGKLYYDNNYPIEVIENGDTKLINIQDLKDRTSLTGEDLYYSLFEFYGLSGGLDVSDVFDQKKPKEVKAYLSSECKFELNSYISNFGEKEFKNFKENVTAIENEISKRDGKLDFMKIEVEDEKVVKVIELYRP